MKTMTVRWEHAPGDIHHVMYFIDNSPVGEDDEGFDKILDTIRTYKNIQVTLIIQHTPSGGNTLEDSLPFRERFDELIEALGKNKLIYEFA
ncbi:MAG: hypothetical protein WBW16_14185 [Bacteroidota bacterium]